MEWTIYSEDYSQVRATTSELEYHSEWMGDEYVVCNIKSEAPIDFAIGDRLIYRTVTFILASDPSVVKKAARDTYGEGFVYSNVKFMSEAADLKNYRFKDVVLADNNLPYSYRDKFPFFASSVEDLADRIKANLDMSSEDEWMVITPSYSYTIARHHATQAETEADALWDENFVSKASSPDEILGETDVNIEVDGISVFEAMKLVYDKFGLSWTISGKTIIIGGDPVMPSNIFRYGRHQGMYEIERTSDEEQEIVTKLFSYGSEKNMPTNYYAKVGTRYYMQVSEKITWEDSQEQYHIAVFLNDGNGTPKSMFHNIVNLPGENTYFSVSTRARYAATSHHSEYTENLTLQYGLNILESDVTQASVGYHAGFYIYSENERDEDYFSVGDTIYFTKNVNEENWPRSLVQRESSYPTLLSIGNLMLPGFPLQSLYDWVTAKRNSSTGTERTQWDNILTKYTFSEDPLVPWVKSANATLVGSREGTTYYDGNSLTEIYPTIVDTGADVVTDGSHITDSGFFSGEDENELKFTISVANNGVLNWEDALSTALEDVKISMTSGYCTGREFKVDSAELSDDESEWELTLIRTADDSLEGRYFPYSAVGTSSDTGYANINIGDTFVVTGIQMPSTYVAAASEKLLIASLGWLDKHDHVRYTYQPRVDEIFMARDQRDSDTAGTTSLHDRLKAGMQFQFEDAADLGIERYGDAAVFIDQITIKEGSESVPTYEIILRDEKEKSVFEKLTEKISEVASTQTTSVVERRTKSLQYIEYSSWDEDTYYYNNAINTTAGNILETSRVWHHNCLWQCQTTGTADEPWFTSVDWLILRATEINLKITSSRQIIMRRWLTGSTTQISVLSFLLRIGSYDATSLITQSQAVWTRQSKGWEDDPVLAAEDTVWNNNHRYGNLTLTLTVADLPSNFSSAREAQYTLTITNDWMIETGTIIIT